MPRGGTRKDAAVWGSAQTAPGRAGHALSLLVWHLQTLGQRYGEEAWAQDSLRGLTR